MKTIFSFTKHKNMCNAGTILGMESINERRRLPLIGWAHTKNDPCN